MADALSAIPTAVLRNLSDKLYEKRKNAALEVEGIVKQLTAAGDHDRINVVINLLTHEYTYSPQANHRKGGLIGLAAVTVGLSAGAAQHLERHRSPGSGCNSARILAGQPERCCSHGGVRFPLSDSRSADMSLIQIYSVFSKKMLLLWIVWCQEGLFLVDGQRMNIRERIMVHSEEIAYFDSGLDVFGSRHHRQHLRHGSPEGLAEIGNLVRLDDDRYREWRLDVDSMSYEELVELGDKIGYVSTGLREDEIRRCVTKTKMPSSSSSSTATQMQCQWKCSICQEEYEGDDEIGKLECGHFYHIYCIKQWVAHKNTCPICKLPLQ